KEWASPSPARAKLVAQLETMEAATRSNKHSAFAGCDASTRAAWEAQLKGLKLPKVPSEGAASAFVAATLGSPEGYLAYQALRLCSAGDENSSKGLDIVGADVVQRGPRTATIAAWMASSAQIKFDDRGLKMNELLANGNLPMSEGARFQQQRQGVIAKIEENEGSVVISFKRVVEPREDCIKWKETDHIETFRADGSPLYRRECLKWGIVKMDLTAEPLEVGKVMAQGLKPGMYLVGIEGFAIVATASAKSTKPIWVFGGSVK
ncbi:MAG TPA: hypothetical protein VFV99_00185, partial [Kofleriaceae bacterium]|nr:hypothetical protein [Kofleriaceae bacterium]